MVWVPGISAVCLFSGSGGIIWLLYMYTRIEYIADFVGGTGGGEEEEEGGGARLKCPQVGALLRLNLSRDRVVAAGWGANNTN